MAEKIVHFYLLSAVNKSGLSSLPPLYIKLPLLTLGEEMVGNLIWSMADFVGLVFEYLYIFSMRLCLRFFLLFDVSTEFGFGESVSVKNPSIDDSEKFP